MLRNRTKPKAVTGLLVSALVAVIALVVVPGMARSAVSTASVSALGTHSRGEVIAGTAGQVFRVEVFYPPERVQPPSANARAAALCGVAVPTPSNKPVPLPDDPACPTELPTPAPTVPALPVIPVPSMSLVPTPIASVPLDPNAVPTPTVDPSAVPTPTPSVDPVPTAPTLPPAPVPSMSIAPTPIASVPAPTGSLPALPIPTASLLPTPIASVPLPPSLPAAPNLNVGPPANFIQITVPSNIIALDNSSYVTGAWTCRNFPGTSRVVCRGGALLPGTSDNFPVIGTIKRPAADAGGTWSISTSDDDGSTLVPSLPVSAGSLDTVARVLQVNSVEITDPAAAVDTTVTEEQDNVGVVCTITNSGSGSPLVTASLSGATSTAPAAVTMGTETTDFTFTDVTFGPAGAGALVCDAAATGADGVAGSLPVTIQTKVAIGSPAEISPPDVIQGATYTFGIPVSKTGAVSVDGGLTGSMTFTDGGVNTFTATLTSPTSLEAGASSPTLTFASGVIPPVADGSYDTEIHLAGVDSNGAVVDLTIDGPSLIVNASLPVIAPTLTPPPSRVPGEPAAAFDGSTVKFGGTVTRFGSPCVTCTLTGASILEFDAASAPVGTGIDVSSALTLTNGVIGGTYAGAYNPATTSAQLVLTVKDNANNATSIAPSPLIDVDNIAPAFVHAVTGGPSHDDPRRIDLDLTEAVGGKTFGPLDFLIVGNLVTHAYRAGDVVVLELLLPLSDDDRPTIFFGSTCVDPALVNTPLCSELFDRVGHPVAGVRITAFDGIKPPAPVLKTVDGDRGQAPDTMHVFYSNDSETLFGVGRVTVGHTLTLALDDDDSGTLEDGDLRIFDEQIALSDCIGDPDSHGRCLVEVESDTIPPLEGTFTVFGYATDALQSGDFVPQTPGADAAPRNRSDAFAETVVFDFTPPVITAAVAEDADTVRVSLSEPVLGRDFGADWLVLASDGVNVQPFQVGTVTGMGDQRTLDIKDDAFGAGWTIVGVTYEYVGPTPTPVMLPDGLEDVGRLLRHLSGPDEQYHDRATNTLDSPQAFTCPVPGCPAA